LNIDLQNLDLEVGLASVALIVFYLAQDRQVALLVPAFVKNGQAVRVVRKYAVEHV
jgi:hypothetical protein